MLNTRKQYRQRIEVLKQLFDEAADHNRLESALDTTGPLYSFSIEYTDDRGNNQSEKDLSRDQIVAFHPWLEWLLLDYDVEIIVTMGTMTIHVTQDN